MSQARECRYNHGRLELVKGSFALTGLRPANPLDSLFKSNARLPDGRMMEVKVWTCPVCGYVELVDEAS